MADYVIVDIFSITSLCFAVIDIAAIRVIAFSTVGVTAITVILLQMCYYQVLVNCPALVITIISITVAISLPLLPLLPLLHVFISVHSQRQARLSNILPALHFQKRV